MQRDCSRGMVVGRREWEFGGGVGGAALPVRVRWVGGVVAGGTVGLRMWGGVFFYRVPFVAFEGDADGFLHDFGTQEQGVS